MTTARENTQPYGGGAGGKIPKRPFRRSAHTTPYDRPSIALRSPNTGWLSKLVDPAQRLIASCASRLFSTVFRKRLTPPPPPSTTAFEPESSRGARNTQQDAVTADTSVERQGDIEQSQSPSNTSNKDGTLIELEQILKQKTFTRSEIERLTALLHSKTADISCENQDKRPDVVPLRLTASPNQQERLPKAPAQENGIESHLISTPLVTSSVLDEGVASPAELAKAYMGSRPSKVSPSMLGSRSQAFRESSSVLNSVPLPSKLPGTPHLPGNFWNSEAPKNGVITPMCRGRSAIYSMARTPYSRIHSLSTLKGVGSPADAYRGSSSSLQSVQEQSSIFGSKQGATKRGSSVLDNDIGSSGPIRRIRQKPNLLSSRGLGSRCSGMQLSSSETGLGPGTAQSPFFSSWKPISFGEAKHDFTKASTNDCDNTLSGSSFSSGPCKSSDMASKILQQLDKLVSPNEKSSEPKLLSLTNKSPSKLSPTMLSGQALKSLDNVDSSNFFGNVQDNNKSDVSSDKLTSSAPYCTSRKQDKAKENGPLKLIAPFEKSDAKVNGVDSAVINKDDTTSVRTAAHVASSSISCAQSKRGFQMSAHEDFLKLDGEGCLTSDLSAKGREKLDASFAEKKSDVPELEKPSSLAKVKPVVCSAMNNKADLGITVGSLHPDKGIGFIASSTSLPSKMIPSTVVSTQSSLLTVVASQSLASDGATKAKESLFNFGDKIASIKNSYSASPVLSFGSKIVDKVSQTQSPTASFPLVATESTSIKFGVFSDVKPETTSCYHRVAASATDSQSNVSEPSQTGDKNNLDSGVSSTASETKLAPAVPVSTSSTNGFLFGQPSNNSGSNNGSFASTLSNNLTPQSSTSSSLFTSSVSNVFASSSTMVTSNGGISTSTLVTSISAAPIFKFGSCSASTAGASVSVAFDENRLKQDSSFGNLSSTPLNGTSAPVAGTGRSNPSGFIATATSTAENQSQGSTLFGAGSGSIPSAQASPAGTGVASFIHSNPVQFSSTSSSPFGVVGNTTFSSGSSLSGSISASKLFGLGAVSGQSSAPSSEANAVSFSSGTTPSLFGSNWQPAKSSTCGSTFNSTSPSTGFSFGGSSTPSSSAFPFGASAPSSTVFSFGGSSASSSTVFSFGGSSASSATTNSTPSSSAFPFGASAPSSTAFSFAGSSASSSTVFSFGGSSASSATTNSTPSSSAFPFGASAPSSTAFSFGGSSASSSTVFSFGGSSASSATTNSTPIVFGSSNGASSNPIFSFASSSASAATQPGFGNANPATTFGHASGNTDQMNMEDSMAEDNVQASTHSVPIFGQQHPFLFSPTAAQTTAPIVPAFGQQQPVSPSPTSFVFGSTGSTAGNSLQFGSQTNLALPQNPSPFQASGSMGSNFSLGSGGSGADKSNRKYVKPVRNKHRKK